MLNAKAQQLLDSTTIDDQAVSLYATIQPHLGEVTQDEWALVAVTVLPAFFLTLTLLGKLFGCGKKKAAPIAPASPPAKGKGGATPAAKKPGASPPSKGKAAAAAPAPALETRKSVLARGQKEPPPGSVGHATRGREGKNPKGGKAYMA